MLHIDRQTLAEDITALPLQKSTRDISSDDAVAAMLHAQSFIDRLLAAQTGADQKHCSILFSDLRGFSVMAQKYTVSQVVDILNRFFSRMIEIIANHGGQIDKLIGDAIMAVFETPRTPEAITQVLRCAIYMQNSMQQLDEELRASGFDSIHMGIGINCGMVLSGYVGSNRYREFTVIGHEVNVASRIESFTMRGQILISEKIHELCRGHIIARSPQFIHPKGDTDGMTIYELTEVTGADPVKLIRGTRRKSKRVNTNIPARYRHVSGKSVEIETHRGIVNNLSYEGMLLQTREALELWSEIYLPTNLSLFSDSNGELYARVVRCSPKDDHFEVGLEFTIIDDTTQFAIRSHIDQIL